MLLDCLTDIIKTKEIVGDKMCLVGGVPATLFKMGTFEEVEAFCKKLIYIAGAGSGFIISSGCYVPDDAKFESVKATVDTANNYRPLRRLI